MLLSDDYWEVRSVGKKGRGVFVSKDIDAGVVIGDYIGKVLRTAEEDTLEGDKGLYLMYYHDQASLYPVDVNAPGVHLMNHSCVPNCWMYTYKGHTLFFALRHIFAGEELTIPYLLSPLDETCNPCTHACTCGEPICTGTMHLSKERYKRWIKFGERQSVLTKKKRVRYGYELPMLSFYPKSIPDAPIYSLFGFMEKAAKVLQDTEMPTAGKLREMIRETGCTLEFPYLKKKVLGVEDGKIILDSNV
jgi:hypothetical protein